MHLVLTVILILVLLAQPLYQEALCLVTVNLNCTTVYIDYEIITLYIKSKYYQRLYNNKYF